MTQPSINPWVPEPDTLLHQALGKLAEECAELSHILTRCLIQGYAESDPGTGQHNYVRLREEMADVRAAMEWLVGLRSELESADSPRQVRKLAGYIRWQAMIEDIVARSQKPLGWRIVNSEGKTIYWSFDEAATKRVRDLEYPDMRVEPMWSHTPAEDDNADPR